MAKYECRICGYEFDEQQAKETFENLYSCPICDADKSSFKLIEEDPKEEPKEDIAETEEFVFEDSVEDSEEKVEEKLESETKAENEENVAVDVTEPSEEPRETFEEFLKKMEEKTDEELKQAEENVKTPEEEKREAIYESIFTVKTDFPEETSEKDFIDELLESSDYVAKPTNPSFTIEKRQEFWKRDDEPKAVVEEKKEETVDNNYASVSHLGSVQKVIGSDGQEDSVSEATEKPVQENNGLIQTFYSFSKPVKTEEELKAEEEARAEKENPTFKPFFGSGMGTIQKVVGQPVEEKEEEFVFEETKDDEVVDALKTEEVVEAVEETVFEETVVETVEEPVFEETVAETAEEPVFEEAVAETVEEPVFEEAVAETVEEPVFEEAVAETAEEPVFEEAVAETVEEPVFEEAVAETVEEPVFEEAVAETVEEPVFEEAVAETVEEPVFEEKVAETIEEPVAEAPVEDAEDDFFFEEVVNGSENEEDGVVFLNFDDNIQEEKPFDQVFENESDEMIFEEDEIILETAKEIIDEPTEDVVIEEAKDDIIRDTAEEIIDEDAVEYIDFGMFDTEATTEEEVTETVEEPVVEEIVVEPVFEETAEETTTEPAFEETVVETVEEPVFEETVVETVEEPAFEETAAETVEEPVFEEVTEEAVAEPVFEEATEGIAVEPIFVESEEAVEDNIPEDIEATEESDEVTDEVTEDRDYICLDEQAEQVPETEIAYSMLKSEMKYTVLYDEEAKKIFEDYPVMDENVSNGLENIILLPAQCNPLPLRRSEPVETKTVIGALTDCPVEVLQPFCFSKLFLWGEHIPNNTRAEEYNNQALILVKGEEGHIPNLSSREELKEEVEIAKARYHGTPVGIDLVAGRIEADLEACVYAKVDFVILNDVSSRILPYALRRARNYLNRVNSKLEILVCVEALKDAQELAKILALGANFVLVERGFDLNMANEMTEALKEICRSTGHDNVHDLNLNDICTIDMDIAMYTDISHV